MCPHIPPEHEKTSIIKRISSGWITVTTSPYYASLEDTGSREIGSAGCLSSRRGSLVGRASKALHMEDASMDDSLLVCVLVPSVDVLVADTGRIPRLVGQPTNDYRMMAVQKLKQSTELDAPTFIYVWLEGSDRYVASFEVITLYDLFLSVGHAFLWKHGLEHGIQVCVRSGN